MFELLQCGLQEVVLGNHLETLLIQNAVTWKSWRYMLIYPHVYLTAALWESSGYQYSWMQFSSNLPFSDRAKLFVRSFIHFCEWNISCTVYSDLIGVLCYLLILFHLASRPASLDSGRTSASNSNNNASLHDVKGMLLEKWTCASFFILQRRMGDIHSMREFLLWWF